MYALFTAIPFVGHLNPLLVQAQELRRRGWRVAVASFGDVRGHVEREGRGLPFVDLGPLAGRADVLRGAMEAASEMGNFAAGAMRIARALATLWPAMFDGLAAAVARDRPDVIVADAFTPAAVCVADAAGIPLVLNDPALLHALPPSVVPPRDDLPSAFSGKSIGEVGLPDRAWAMLLRAWPGLVQRVNGSRAVAAQRRAMRLPPVDVEARLRGRTVLVTSAFGFEHPRPLPPGIEMVGPCLPEQAPALSAEWDMWLTDGLPVVYANLGTVAIPRRRLLTAMVEAFAAVEQRVLWVLRPSLASHLPAPLPPRLRIVEWGPPLPSVLAHPNVRAFVSHCGPNSAYESLAAQTPIVGIPMFADQSDVAARVVDAGIGVRLDKRRCTSGELRQAIDRVMTDGSLVRNLAAVQQAIAATGGVRRAADIIERAAVSRESAFRAR